MSMTRPAWLRPAALLLAALCAAPAFANLPPLIDREQFFGDPEITSAQLSPDGRFIAFIKPFHGTRNIWVKETGKEFSTARPLTADTQRPIPGFFWTHDGKRILFIQDQAGDENFNLFAVDPAAKAPAGKDVPEAKDLTGLKGVRVVPYGLPKSQPNIAFIGLNDRDKAWHDLYRLDLITGERTLLRKNTDRITGWVFDHKGTLRLASRTTEAGDTEILRVDAQGFTKIAGCGVLEECGPSRFDAKDQRVYFETNHGDDIDLSRLTLLDPATGRQELVEADPENRVDFGEAIFSEKTDELVGTAYVDDKVRIQFRDPSWKADYDFLQRKFPGMEVSPGSITRDDRLWLIEVRSPSEPGERYLFDRQTKKLSFEYRLRPELPRNQLAQVKVIRYPSSDGLTIPAYLTLPSGVPAKGLPLVVLPHGGPWARTNFEYNGLAQFLANRGYAVLEPNFRASTGYGKKFLNAGNRQWGDKMQDDLTWGVKHLVADGTADPKRVAIMGGSYGGYATLAGVTFTPDLYAAAVAIVAPSNLISLLETIPPYWEAGRKIFTTRMGDPATPEGRAQLTRQSPLTHAAKIRTPLMVVQGANDPRVNKREADQIVVALRDRGFPVRYIVAPDEGHGFHRPINNLATFAATEAFLAQYVGGRFQPEMKPEVAQRLKELTVDPKTVVLTKKLAADQVQAPKPESDLQARTEKFRAVFSVGGREMKLDVTREIKEEGGAWVITDLTQTPQGKMSDRTVVQKGTLQTTAREVAQGPMNIGFKCAAGKATGSMSMGGNQRPIDAELGGPLFADGSSESDVLARLPLSPGYAATYRQFDLQTGKPVFKQLKVGGKERVTVAAGTFEAVKMQVNDAEGPGKMTLWIDPGSRRVVKQTGVVPQMGGASYTTELLP